MPKCLFWVFVFLFAASEISAFRTQRLESWTGRWFPAEPTYRPDIAKGHDGRIPMGIVNPKCDDGKANLTLDWDNSFEDYTCINPRSRFVPNQKTEAQIEFENIPKAYMSYMVWYTTLYKNTLCTKVIDFGLVTVTLQDPVLPITANTHKYETKCVLQQAPHFCMDTQIKYDHPVPTFGPHRPLWPIFGEYKFLPKQRWLHSLEHGGIVALYHPCADLRQIELLKKLVKGCLRRYVITPSKDLSGERPLGLLAWGARYTMSTVYPNAVRQFIKENALKGPEKVADDGQFNFSLIEKASIVSDFQDSNLCPGQ